MTHVVLRSGKFIIKFYIDDVKADDISKALAEADEYFSDEAEQLGEYEFIVLGVYDDKKAGRVLIKEGVVGIVPLI